MSSIIRTSSSEIGDYMGMENGCTDMEDIDELLLPTTKKIDTVVSNPKRRGKWSVEKEFPPLIPLLARTENLPSHMPWVLKRYYTDDGRLVLYEEKVRHHEYMKAHRQNGRLILQLVQMDSEFISEFPPGDERDGNVGYQDDDYDEYEDSDQEHAHEDVNSLEESMVKLACS